MLVFFNLKTILLCPILALTDLMVGILVMPNNIKFYYYDAHWTSSQIMCHFWLICDVLSCTASIWSLVAIAVDRWMVCIF